jgi:hypothetical protein
MCGGIVSQRRMVGMAIRDGRFHVLSADGELLILSPR